MRFFYSFSYFLLQKANIFLVVLHFQEDLNLWLPNTKNPPTDLDLEIARFTLVQVGDQFCDLLTQEAEALNIHISEGK